MMILDNKHSLYKNVRRHGISDATPVHKHDWRGIGLIVLVLLALWFVGDQLSGVHHSADQSGINAERVMSKKYSAKRTQRYNNIAVRAYNHDANYEKALHKAHYIAVRISNPYERQKAVHHTNVVAKYMHENH